MAGGGKMIGWDILNKALESLPSLANGFLWVAVVVAVVVFIVGFAKYGFDFIKHGFKQNTIDELTSKLATKEDIGRLDAKIEAIETNHFGHLKNYLGILNGVLFDKKIIDNETRARLDNELRGM
jgi:hypothetical protein